MPLRSALLLVVALLASSALGKPPATPPTEAAQRALLKKKDALKHLKVYLVSEACLDPEVPPLKGKRLPAGVGTAGFGTAEAMSHNLTLSLPSASHEAVSFAEFKAWADPLASAGSTLAYSEDVMAGTVYGYRALCLRTPALLGPAEFKRGESKSAYELVPTAAGLAKLKALPRGTVRLAMVWDDEVVMLDVFVKDLDLETEPVVLPVRSLK